MKDHLRLEAPIKTAGEYLCGSDGARHEQWITLGTQGTHLSAALFPGAKDLAGLGADRHLIDIPIGLPAAGPRLAEQDARSLLGSPRASSVFPAPVRAVLGAKSQSQASLIGRSIDGRGVSAQTYSILARIAAVDSIMSPLLQARLREAHPELSFAAWAGAPMLASKKTPSGRAARRALVDSFFGPSAFPFVRALFPRALVRDDDILDAFACLWSSIRLARGTASVLPYAAAQVDPHGLRMEHVF
jgi:predicted RNase H-like nuclease